MFLDRLPQRHSPRRRPTGREGFLHPYTIEGGVGEVKIRVLLRDFDTPNLAEQAELLREAGRAGRARSTPRPRIDVEVKPQYRNMADGMRREPRAVPFAEEAMRRAGLTPKQTHHPRRHRRLAAHRARACRRRTSRRASTTSHSPLEWTCLEEMEAAVRVVVELVQVWAGR